MAVALACLELTCAKAADRLSAETLTLSPIDAGSRLFFFPIRGTIS